MAFAKLNSMKFVGLDGLSHFWSKAKTWIIDRITTEVTSKIAEIVANAPEDLDTLKEISDWISSHANDAAAMNAEIKANTEAISGKADKSHSHTKSDITDFEHTHDDRYYTESEIDTKLSGKSDTGHTHDNRYYTESEIDTKLSGKADKSHTHTKSEITDFPTSLPANGGTADFANVPTGFCKIGNQDHWGNRDGVFITDWQTSPIEGGEGDISFRFNKGQLNLIIDGVFYQNEGKYKLVDENSLKDIMKPNYTTGRLPAGVYKAGQTVSASASITTTRGNPVFISYAGDFNSVNHGSTVPWIAFKLFVDDQIVQRTSVDNSVALESDNTPFAGNALAVLSTGSHIIKLDAVLYGDASGQIQFQEQDNLVNLVAFEL